MEHRKLHSRNLLLGILAVTLFICGAFVLLSDSSDAQSATIAPGAAESINGQTVYNSGTDDLIVTNDTIILNATTPEFELGDWRIYGYQAMGEGEFSGISITILDSERTLFEYVGDKEEYFSAAFNGNGSPENTQLGTSNSFAGPYSFEAYTSGTNASRNVILQSGILWQQWSYTFPIYAKSLDGPHLDVLEGGYGYFTLSGDDIAIVYGGVRLHTGDRVVGGTHLMVNASLSGPSAETDISVFFYTDSGNGTLNTSVSDDRILSVDGMKFRAVTGSVQISQDVDGNILANVEADRRFEVNGIGYTAGTPETNTFLCSDGSVEITKGAVSLLPGDGVYLRGHLFSNDPEATGNIILEAPLDALEAWTYELALNTPLDVDGATFVSTLGTKTVTLVIDPAGSLTLDTQSGADFKINAEHYFCYQNPLSGAKVLDGRLLLDSQNTIALYTESSAVVMQGYTESGEDKTVYLMVTNTDADGGRLWVQRLSAYTAIIKNNDNPSTSYTIYRSFDGSDFLLVQELAQSAEPEYDNMMVDLYWNQLQLTSGDVTATIYPGYAFRTTNSASTTGTAVIRGSGADSSGMTTELIDGTASFEAYFVFKDHTVMHSVGSDVFTISGDMLNVRFAETSYVIYPYGNTEPYKFDVGGYAGSEFEIDLTTVVPIAGEIYFDYNETQDRTYPLVKVGTTTYHLSNPQDATQGRVPLVIVDGDVVLYSSSYYSIKGGRVEVPEGASIGIGSPDSYELYTADSGAFHVYLETVVYLSIDEGSELSTPTTSYANHGTGPALLSDYDPFLMLRSGSVTIGEGTGIIISTSHAFTSVSGSTTFELTEQYLDITSAGAFECTLYSVAAYDDSTVSVRHPYNGSNLTLKLDYLAGKSTIKSNFSGTNYGFTISGLEYAADYAKPAVIDVTDGEPTLLEGYLVLAGADSYVHRSGFTITDGYTGNVYIDGYGISFQDTFVTMTCPDSSEYTYRTNGGSDISFSADGTVWIDSGNDAYCLPGETMLHHDTKVTAVSRTDVIADANSTLFLEGGNAEITGNVSYTIPQTGGSRYRLDGTFSISINEAASVNTITLAEGGNVTYTNVNGHVHTYSNPATGSSVFVIEAGDIAHVTSDTALGVSGSANILGTVYIGTYDVYTDGTLVSVELAAGKDVEFGSRQVTCPADALVAPLRFSVSDGDVTLESGTASLDAGFDFIYDGNGYTTASLSQMTVSERDITLASGSVSFGNAGSVTADGVAVTNIGDGTVTVGKAATNTAKVLGSKVQFSKTAETKTFNVPGTQTFSFDSELNVEVESGTVILAAGESITYNDVTYKAVVDSELDFTEKAELLSGEVSFNGELTVGEHKYRGSDLSVGIEGSDTIVTANNGTLLYIDDVLWFHNATATLVIGDDGIPDMQGAGHVDSRKKLSVGGVLFEGYATIDYNDDTNQIELILESTSSAIDYKLKVTLPDTVLTLEPPQNTSSSFLVDLNYYKVYFVSGTVDFDGELLVKEDMSGSTETFALTMTGKATSVIETLFVSVSLPTGSQLDVNINGTSAALSNTSGSTSDLDISKTAYSIILSDGSVNVDDGTVICSDYSISGKFSVTYSEDGAYVGALGNYIFTVAPPKGDSYSFSAPVGETGNLFFSRDLSPPEYLGGSIGIHEGSHLVADEFPIFCLSGIVYLSSDSSGDLVLSVPQSSSATWGDGAVLISAEAIDDMVLQISEGSAVYSEGSGIITLTLETALTYSQKVITATADDVSLLVTEDGVAVESGSVILEEGATVYYEDASVTSTVGQVTVDGDGNVSIPAEATATVMFGTSKAVCVAAAETPSVFEFILGDSTLEHSGGYGTVSLDSGLSIIYNGSYYTSSSTPSVFTIDENGITLASGMILVPESSSTVVNGIVINAEVLDAYVDPDGKVLVSKDGKISAICDQYSIFFTASEEAILALTVGTIEIESGFGTAITSGNVPLTYGDFFGYSDSATLVINSSGVELTDGSFSVTDGCSITVGGIVFESQYAGFEVDSECNLTIDADSSVKITSGQKVMEFEAAADSSFTITDAKVVCNGAKGTMTLTGFNLEYSGYAYTASGTVGLGLGSDELTLTSGKITYGADAWIIVDGKMLICNEGSISVSSDGTISVSAESKITHAGDGNDWDYTADTDSVLRFTDDVVTYVSGTGALSSTIYNLVYKTKTYGMDNSEVKLSADTIELTYGSVVVAPGASITVGDVLITSTIGNVTVDMYRVVIPENGKATFTVDGSEMSYVSASDSDMYATASGIEHFSGNGTVSLDSGFTLDYSGELYNSCYTPTVFQIDDDGITLVSGMILVPEGTSSTMNGITVSADVLDAKMDPNGKVLVSENGKVTVSGTDYTLEFTASEVTTLACSDSAVMIESGYGSAVITGTLDFGYDGSLCGSTDAASLSITDAGMELTGGSVTLYEGSSLIVSDTVVKALAGDIDIDTDMNLQIPEDASVKVTAGTKTVTFEASEVSSITIGDIEIFCNDARGTVTLTGYNLNFEQVDYLVPDTAKLTLEFEKVSLIAGTVTIETDVSVYVGGNKLICNEGTLTVSYDGTINYPEGSKSEYFFEGFSVHYTATTASVMKYASDKLQYVSGTGTFHANNAGILTFSGRDYIVVAGSMNVTADSLIYVDGTVTLPEGGSIALPDGVVTAKIGTLEISGSNRLNIPENGKVLVTKGTATSEFVATADSIIYLDEVGTDYQEGACTVTLSNGAVVKYGNNNFTSAADGTVLVLDPDYITITNGSVTFGDNRSIVVSGMNIRAYDSPITVASDGTVTVPAGSEVKYAVDNDYIEYSAVTDSVIRISADSVTYISGTGTLSSTVFDVIYKNKSYAVEDAVFKPTSEHLELTNGSVILVPGAEVVVADVAFRSEVGNIAVEANARATVPANAEVSFVANGSNMSYIASAESVVAAYETGLEPISGMGTVSLDNGLTLSYDGKDYVSYSSPTVFKIDENGVTVVSGMIKIGQGKSAEVNGVYVTAVELDVLVDPNGKLIVPLGGKVTAECNSYNLEFTATSEATLVCGIDSVKVESGYGTLTVNGTASIALEGLTCSTNDGTTFALSASGINMVSGSVVLPEGASVTIGTTVVKAVAGSIEVDSERTISVPAGSTFTSTENGVSMSYQATVDSSVKVADDGLRYAGGEGKATLAAGMKLYHANNEYSVISQTAVLAVSDYTVELTSGTVNPGANCPIFVDGVEIYSYTENTQVSADGLVSVPADSLVVLSKDQSNFRFESVAESTLKLDDDAFTVNGKGSLHSAAYKLVCNSEVYLATTEVGIVLGDDRNNLDDGTLELNNSRIYFGDASIFGVATVNVANSECRLTVSDAYQITYYTDRSHMFSSVEGASFEAIAGSDLLEIISGTVVFTASEFIYQGYTFSGTGKVEFGSEIVMYGYGTDAITVANSIMEVSYASIENGSYVGTLAGVNRFELQQGTVLIPEQSSLTCGSLIVDRQYGEVYITSDEEFILGPHAYALIRVAGLSTFSLYDDSTGYPIKNDSGEIVTLPVEDTFDELKEFYDEIEVLREEIISSTSPEEAEPLLAELDAIVYDAAKTKAQNESKIEEVNEEFEEIVSNDNISRFEEYKAELILQLDALHVNGETATAAKIIETAKTNVSKTYYNNELSYGENRARLADYQPDIISDKITDNDEEMFNAYKQKVLAAIEALHVGETCRGEKILIDEAYNDASLVVYSPQISILDNQAELDFILGECKSALGEYRSSNDVFDNYVSTKIEYVQTQPTFGSRDAVKLVEDYVSILSSMQYLSSDTLDNNLNRVDATVTAFEKAINTVAVREFTKYKEEQQGRLIDMLSQYYEPEIKALITGAQTDLASVYYAPNVPYENSIIRIDNIMSDLESEIEMITTFTVGKFNTYCGKYVEQFEKTLAKYEGDEPIGGLTPEVRAAIAEAIRSAIDEMNGLKYDSSQNLAANKVRADEVANNLSVKISQISGEENFKNAAEYYAKAVDYVSNKVISGSTDKIDAFVDATKDKLAEVYDSTDFYDAESLAQFAPRIQKIIDAFDAELPVYVATADYDRVVDAAVDYLEERYGNADATTVKRMAECIAELRAREYDSSMELLDNQLAIENMTNDFSVELFKLRMQTIEGEFESYRDYLVWTLFGKNESNSTPEEVKLAKETIEKLKAVKYKEGSLLQNQQALDIIYKDYLAKSADLAKRQQTANFNIQKDALLKELRAMPQTEIMKKTLSVISSVEFDAFFTYEENLYGLEYLKAVATGSSTDVYETVFNDYRNGIWQVIRGENQYDQSDRTKAFIADCLAAVGDYTFQSEFTYLENKRAVALMFEDFKTGLEANRYLDNSTTIGNINADGTSTTGGAAEYPEGETQIWGIIANAGGLGDGAAATIERTEVPAGIYDADTYAAEGSTVAVLSKGNALGAFDICIYENGSKVSNFNGTYRIMILLPADMRGYESMQVAYADEFGKLQVYDATVDGNYLVFYTTHFSTFYVLGLVEDHPEYDYVVYIGFALILVLIVFLLTHVVRFDANGGTGSTGTIVFFGQGEGKLPANGFSKEGSRFAGWSRTPDAGAELIAEGSEIETLGKFRFLKLYAVWENDSQGGKE